MRGPGWPSSSATARDRGGINGGITHAFGKGGRSFNTGANPDGEDGVRTGAGEVVITKL